MSLLARNILVAGLGVSGVAAAGALLSAGARRVAVTDDHFSETVRATAEELAARGARIVEPRGDESGWSHSAWDFDLVVASPGLSPAAPVPAAALRRGTEIVSEPELAWRLSGGRLRLVGVTGTNGKTTTTELLATSLGVPAAGNIGRPLCDLALDPPPLVVAELSSFQLNFTSRLRADVAVLTNVAPDHLDWHGAVSAYGAAKARLWARQRSSGSPCRDGRDWVVAQRGDDGSQAVLAAHPAPGGLLTCVPDAPGPGHIGVEDGAIVERVTEADGEAVVSLSALHLTGPHNLANVCAAVGAVCALGSRPADLGARLAGYRPGAHRLETVAHDRGVRWVDDSKATNPHAAAAALTSFERVIWIAGGLNKGLAFAELADVVAARVRTAVTIGESGPELAALTRRLGVPTIEAGELARAVREARAVARPGDVVLLAPACASMDQFRDYAERGDRFRALIEAEEGVCAGPDA